MVEEPREHGLIGDNVRDVTLEDLSQIFVTFTATVKENESVTHYRDNDALDSI